MGISSNFERVIKDDDFDLEKKWLSIEIEKVPLEILIEHNTKSNFDGLFWFEYVFMEMFNILIF